MNRLTALFLALSLPFGAFAATPAATPAPDAPPAMSQKPAALTPAEAELKKTIEERLKLTVDEITPLPIAGLYEVRVGTKLIYSDVKGDYVFTGNLIDLRARVDLTAERVDALKESTLPKVKLADLPLNSAIKIVKGSGKSQIAIFEDPNCSYCKRLEHSLENISDVTLYVFLYPVLGDDSVAKSRAIWCAKDPAKAWSTWMMNGSAPTAPASGCNSATIDQNVALGKKLDVSGTPTLFFSNGKRVPGAITDEEIGKMIAAAG